MRPRRIREIERARQLDHRLQDRGPARWTTPRVRGNTEAAARRFHVDAIKRQRRKWIRAIQEGQLAGDMREETRP